MKTTAVKPAFNVEEIRAQFPILKELVHGKPLVYFDNAATSQKPRRVIKAESAYYATINANVHRGVHALSTKATEAQEAAREIVRKHINAKHAHEIIFTSGTTAGINLAATSLGQLLLKKGDEVVITVRDDGMGIPADMLAAVFDLFVQTDAARGQAQGGLGIGLTLVRRLVEMHGGTITAASEGAGKGSTFTLRLPAAPEAAVAAPPPGSARLSPRRRVLVVDDNIDAADCLADALRDAGHEVRVENDGLAALASTTSWLPDVALIDIGMPGIDGYEVARRLRAAHPRARLRLVALTGFGQEGDLLLAQVAGFDVHLVKPANLERITAALAG